MSTCTLPHTLHRLHGSKGTAGKEQASRDGARLMIVWEGQGKGTQLSTSPPATGRKETTAPVRVSKGATGSVVHQYDRDNPGRIVSWDVWPSRAITSHHLRPMHAGCFRTSPSLLSRFEIEHHGTLSFLLLANERCVGALEGGQFLLVPLPLAFKLLGDLLLEEEGLESIVALLLRARQVQ